MRVWQEGGDAGKSSSAGKIRLGRKEIEARGRVLAGDAERAGVQGAGNARESFRRDEINSRIELRSALGGRLQGERRLAVRLMVGRGEGPQGGNGSATSDVTAFPVIDGAVFG